MRFVLTGVSRGIGRQVCEQLRDQGHQVYGVVRPGHEPPAGLGLSGQVAADLADSASVAAALQPVVAGLDRLDGLVHAAGVVRGAGPDAGDDGAATTVADFTEQFALVTSAVEVTRALLPALRAGGGTVVFLNSGAGLTAGGSPLVAYGASKFALRSYADSLRLEEPALRVTSVYPGRTATDMQRRLRELEGASYVAEDYLEPSTVAAVVVSALLLPCDGVLTDVVLRPRPRRTAEPVGDG